MARGINKVILVGTLGKDPETRYSQSGTCMCSISVATNESWKDKDGEKQERTEWHRVKFFGPLAEIADEYLQKGGQVYIEGSLRTEKYTDKQGVEKYSTDIIAKEMQMLGAKLEGGGDRDRGREETRGRDTGRTREPARDAGRAPARGRDDDSRSSGRGYGERDSGRQAPARAPARDDEPFPDDDIPF